MASLIPNKGPIISPSNVDKPAITTTGVRVVQPRTVSYRNQRVRQVFVEVVTSGITTPLATQFTQQALQQTTFNRVLAKR
jgi:hypothetical protein